MGGLKLMKHDAVPHKFECQTESSETNIKTIIQDEQFSKLAYEH